MLSEVVGFSGGKAEGSVLFLLKQHTAKGEQSKPVKFSVL